MEEANISEISAKGVGQRLKIEPASAVKAAPVATFMDPFKPAALPVSDGRTDIAPELLLGMVRPLPMPTKMVLPKKKTGDRTPASKTKTPNDNPAQVVILPASIIVVSRKRGARRPERKLPNMKPPVMLPMKRPSWPVEMPKAVSATKGTPETKM